MVKKMFFLFLILLVLAAGFFYMYKRRSTSPTFAFVVLPDTQKYSESDPSIFCGQTQWIVDNRDVLNIQFVSHMGDIVENQSTSLGEWSVASNCMGFLETGKIPYGIIPGNHDTDSHYREDGLSVYDRFFPAERYTMYPWYKGNRKNNQNNYQVISVPTIKGAKKFLFLNLEVEPSANTLTWANEVVAQYPDVYTILTTHKYLTDSGQGLDQTRLYSRTGHTGQEIWDKLVKNNCSIKMVWNGHFHSTDGEDMLVSKNACGQDVYQITQDYQARNKGGNGLLRIYTFNPSAKTIDVQTYSPHIKIYEADPDSQFTIPFE